METFYCEGKEVEEQENTEERDRQKQTQSLKDSNDKMKKHRLKELGLISLRMGSLRGNLLLPTPTSCKVVEKIQTECLQRQTGKCRRKKTNFATWEIFVIY